MYKAKFISLEEDEKDLIVSFAIEDSHQGVITLMLHRTLFFEEYLDEAERGTKVSLQGVNLEQEHLNVLKHININPSTIEIKSLFNEYRIDISNIEAPQIDAMLKLLKKQNYDNRFTIKVG